jgi:TetR/AcrR family transcriptional regulator, regulator of biofilm formation and stress response
LSSRARQATSNAPGSGRQALIDATVRIVARKGLRGLTYRQVADEAGVTYGLVSHHFGSRDALVQETLEYAFRASIALSFLQRPPSGLEDFGRGLAEVISATESQQVFEYEMGLEARRRPEMLAELRAVYEEYVTLVERQLRAIGIDRERSFARLIFAALDGLVLQQVFFGRAEETEAGIEELKGLLERVAAPPGSAEGS